MLTSQKITHAHNTVIADIVCGKKSGPPTIYHYKYPYSCYILITTAYYKYIFIVPYFLVIYTLLLEFHIFLYISLHFLEISSLK